MFLIKQKQNELLEYKMNKFLSPALSSLATSPPISGSNSVATTTRTSTPINQSSSSHREELMALLGIPQHLSARTDSSSRFGYRKYKAYLDAHQQLLKMISDGSWPGKKPSSADLIEIFVSKSMWFLHYKPAFSNITEYPQMVKWLEDSFDKNTDLEVWGVEKKACNAKTTKTLIQKFQ